MYTKGWLSLGEPNATCPTTGLQHRVFHGNNQRFIVNQQDSKVVNLDDGPD